MLLAAVITMALLSESNALASGEAGTYTFYSIRESDKPSTIQAQIDVCVVSLGNVSSGKLFFPQMQVNLGPSNQGEFDGGHIGIQYTQAGSKISNWGAYFREFTTPNYRYTPFFYPGPTVNDENVQTPTEQAVVFNPDPGVNVHVGHFDPGTYTQSNEQPASYFDWQIGTWYRYIVYRGGQINGYYSWHGWIKNLSTGTDYYIGAVYTKASFIDSFNAVVETGISDNTNFDVRFVYPKYMLANGTFVVPDPNATSVSLNSVNIYDSVVAPDKADWDLAQTVWHRNALAVPVDAYKAYSLLGGNFGFTLHY